MELIKYNELPWSDPKRRNFSAFDGTPQRMQAMSIRLPGAQQLAG
jgi:hypothetical protein